MYRLAYLLLMSLLVGCSAARERLMTESAVSHRHVDDTRSAPIAARTDDSGESSSDTGLSGALSNKIQTVSAQQEADPEMAVEMAAEVESGLDDATAKSMDSAGPVHLNMVVDSVYQSYPLLISALFSRNIALGQQISASGAFDTRLLGASENGPTGFYQTYRQSLGVVQPTMWGGQLFAGYRVGRGDFQPWYLERQTNDGGEFKAGVLVPLARNRDIDQRRAELWKAGYNRQQAEPDIQAQLIGFVQEASYAYWDWVAAGENHRIAIGILALAEERTDRIREQVEAEFVDPPQLKDNLRLVAMRQAKVADTRRKLQQTAAKLSVFLRDAYGQPRIPEPEFSPGFPEPVFISDEQLQVDIQLALSARPELRYLDFVRRQIDIDYAEAVNQLQPELDAVIAGSQDVGQATSSKRDKSEFEGEASLYLDVPLQRRKARGKITELQGKVAQINAKRRITGDKIVVDVQMAYAALTSAWEQVQLTREAVEQAEDLARIERQLQEAGTSDLLNVALREQFAVESAEKEVEALLLYFISQADYRAAMAQDEVR